MRERFRHGDQLGISSVDVAPGRPELIAEVLFPPLAELAVPARRVDPGDSDTIVNTEQAGSFSQGFHPSHHLVTGDDRQPWRRRPPLDLVELRVADATGAHPNENLAGSGYRVRPVGGHKRRPVVPHRAQGLEQHGTHRG